MAEILFVGTERVGCHVPEVSGKTVHFTGEQLHLADVRDMVLSDNYQCVIFDLSMFVDNYELLAKDFESLSRVSNARFIFYFLGKNTRSALISALMEKGFYLFVTDSIASRANAELKKCLDGYATLEPEEPEEPTPESEDVVPEQKQICISVGGCCARMGTTTQAIQMVQYLQYLGHKACYVQMNDTKYVETLQSIYTFTTVDSELACVTYNGVDMYSKPEYIAKIKTLDYAFIIFDYGNMAAPSFNIISFLERDIRIVVGGDSPSEVLAMTSIFNSALLQSDVYYLYNFIHESGKSEILELMADKADHVAFTTYTPDAYVYNTENNAVFDSMLHAPNISTKRKKSFFPFLSKNKQGGTK